MTEEDTPFILLVVCSSSGQEFGICLRPIFYSGGVPPPALEKKNRSRGLEPRSL